RTMPRSGTWRLMRSLSTTVRRATADRPEKPERLRPTSEATGGGVPWRHVAIVGKDSSNFEPTIAVSLIHRQIDSRGLVSRAAKGTAKVGAACSRSGGKGGACTSCD